MIIKICVKKGFPVTAVGKKIFLENNMNIKKILDIELLFDSNGPISKWRNGICTAVFHAVLFTVA